MRNSLANYIRFSFFSHLRECKTLTGNQIDLKVTGGTNITEVKLEIAKSQDCDVRNIRLMKGRKFLANDDESLASYGIQSGSKLKVIIRMVSFIPSG